MGPRTRVFAIVLALSLGALVSCTDRNSPPPPSATNDLPSLIVSAPVFGAAIAGAGAAVSGSVAYVSLPPGSVATGITATIQDHVTGASASARMLNGGFDPVSIAANIGDTLFVSVRAGSGAPVTGYQVVAASRTPRVVRTSPPPHKVDVPLNASVIVVFSAPMDSASLVSNITLSEGGAPVPGSVVILPNDGSILLATFVPASKLSPLTTYIFEVGAGARDRDGNAFDESVDVDFTTGVQGLAISLAGPAYGDTMPAGFVGFKMQISSQFGLVAFSAHLANPAASVNNLAEDANGQMSAYLGKARWNMIESVAPGTYTVTLSGSDSANHYVEAAPFSVTIVDADPAPRILVRSFSMIEIATVPPVVWTYSPQLVVTDVPGGGGLDILGMEILSLPGLPAPFPRAWARPIWVPEGQDTPLFRELYGGYETFYYARDGHRSAGGTAIARLTYRDLTGHIYITTITGPIVPGNYPTTYTGGCGNWLGEMLNTELGCSAGLSLSVR